ncbi:MAG: hypothetical protein WAU05_01080, partial [Nitrospira sp.]
EGLACCTAIQGDGIRGDSKVPAQHCSQASVSQHITLPDIVPNKARCSVPLDFIQPAGALLQAAL